MKKAIKKIFLLIVAIFLLTGCSSGSGISRPSNKQILSDIQESFDEYYQERHAHRFHFEMMIEDFEIELSQTGDKTFIASINGIAKSTYADFYWPAEIVYTKYDQGWSIDSCSWGEYTYNAVRYPNKEEIDQMISNLNITSTQKGDITYAENSLAYQIKTEADWSEYASGTAISVITWTYDQYNDDWDYDGTKSKQSSFKLNKELEGQWALYGDTKGGYMSITNVTDTGLDIEVNSSYYPLSTTHLELNKGEITWNGVGTLELTLSRNNTSFVIMLPQKPSIYCGITDVDLLFTLTHPSGTIYCMDMVLNQSSKIK